MALLDLPEYSRAAIAAAVLDECSAGSPYLDAWGDIRADAEFWADCANPRELEVYFASTLTRLENQNLGLRARKRLIAKLFKALGPAEQQAFLTWAEGKA